VCIVSAVSVDGGHRIGEFARRVGVTPELLRAWEQRYGLLRPVRTPGGFRLYGENDAERVARMRQALDEGLSAAQAARVALESAPSPDGLIDDARARLMRAIESYDEAAVQAALDDGLAAFGLETFVRDLILPTLSAVGRAWEQGSVEISQEHFASNLIRGRLLALARLWGRGSGPLALLACPQGEQHDISLLAFGLILRSHGWRILFLGADTPLSTIQQTARRTAPAAIVLVTFDTALVETEGTALRRLARIAPLFLSGPGAPRELTGRLRVRHLDGDPIDAAHDVAMMTNE
jgi:DNA-binding transcriptional MerR regulator